MVGLVACDAEGRFKVTLDDDGDNELVVSGPGRPRLVLHAKASEGVREVPLGEVRLENGRTLRGSVADSITAALVKNQRVEAHWGAGTYQRRYGNSQADGTFEIEGASARAVTLEVSAEHYATSVIEVPPGAGPLKVRLEPLGSLELKVYDKSQPAVGVEVHAVGPARDGKSANEVRELTTDGLGTVRFEDARAGEWSLTFRFENQPFGKPVKVSLKPGEAKSFISER